MILEEYRKGFAFFDQENNQVLRVANFQGIVRHSYEEYLRDGRKYVDEIRKEYSKYSSLLADEMQREYYAMEYAQKTWQKDCELFWEEASTLIRQCNHEFLAMPKGERTKTIKRLEILFERYGSAWKFQFIDFETLKEDFRYFKQWQEK